jgi:hypothetical protein
VTPEEKKVVQLAIEMYTERVARPVARPRESTEKEFYAAAFRLIVSCPECNAGGHTCPGCGASVGHGDTACRDCSSEISGPPTWDPDYPGCAPETCGGSRLDPCRTVLQTQGLRHDDDADDGTFSPPLVRPPACANCAPVRAGASVDRVDGSDLDTPCRDCGAVEETEPTWASATWSVVLPGDRVRLASVEATVVRRYAGEWYSRIDTKILDDGRVWDKLSPWRHREVKVALQMDGRPEKSYTMPPEGEVEILCSAERTAILLVQTELGQRSDWPQEAGEWNRKVMASEDPVATYFAHKRAAERMGPRDRGSIWTKPEAKR